MCSLKGTKYSENIVTFNPNSQIDRIKAVIHASNVWIPVEIADALLIHETTVRQHLKDCSLSKKLKHENGGSRSYLS